MRQVVSFPLLHMWTSWDFPSLLVEDILLTNSNGTPLCLSTDKSWPYAIYWSVKVMISDHLRRAAFYIHFQESKTVDFTRVASEVKAIQWIVCHESLSNGNCISWSNLVEAQIEMYYRLVLFDCISKVFTHSAWLSVALTKTVPAKVYNLEIRIESHYLCNASRSRACNFIPPQVQLLDIRVWLLAQLNQTVDSRIGNLVLRKIQSL